MPTTTTLKKKLTKKEKTIKASKAVANRGKINFLDVAKNGREFIKSRFKYKFSTKVQEFPIEKITLRPDIFQGRTVPFAKETVDKIVSEGYDKSQEPIILYFDDKTKQNIVISGHSRFESAKKLSKSKDIKKRITKIPVKFFNGDLDDAIDYALIESNRSGTTEGIESDIKAYSRAKDRGYNKQFLKNIFKSDSYLHILNELSYLNPKGRFIEILAKGNENEAKSFPYLLRNAVWTGQLRRIYDKLTNEHETEMFNFFYKTDKGLKVKKDSFFDIVKKRVEDTFFDPKKGLQLNKTREFDYIKETDPAVIRLSQIKSAIKSWQDERNKKEESVQRFLLRGMNSESTKTKKTIADISSALEKKIIEFIQFEDKVKSEDSRLGKSGFF